MTYIDNYHIQLLKMNCSTEKKERLGPLDIQQTGQTWRCQAVANIGRIIIKANRRSETMFAKAWYKMKKDPKVY